MAMADRQSPNTTANATAPPPITVAETWVQLIFFYLILAGILATVGNIAIAIGIFRSSKLRNRFFIFVGFLTVNRIILSIQYATLAVYRSLRTVGIIDMNLRMGTCYALHIHLTYGLSLEMFLILILVVDRMMAIMVYNYYRNLTSRQAINLCFGVYFGAVLFKLIPSFFGVDFGKVAPCLTAYSPVSPLFTLYTQNIDLALALLILLLYAGLLFYLRCYKLPIVKKNANDAAGQAAMLALKRQMNLMPLLCRLVLIHCSLALASKLLLSLASIAPAAYSQRLVAYGGSLITVDLFVNVVMLLGSNKELRQAIWPRRSNIVEPTKTNVTGMVTIQNTITVMPRSKEM